MRCLVSALKRAVSQRDPSLVRATLADIREKERDLQAEMGQRYDERKGFKAQLQMDVQKANRYLDDVEKHKSTLHGRNRIY